MTRPRRPELGRPKLGRVRPEEWLLGVFSLALLVVLFGSAWYRMGAAGPLLRFYYRDVNGWQALSILGPLTLVVALGGIAVVVLQAVCRAPALPVCATAVEMSLAFVVTVGLIVRVLIARPALRFDGPFKSVVHVRFGGYAGLALAVAVLVGAYLSLRSDGVAAADAPQQIETLRLAPRHTP
jgi:hypothetical protein